MKLAYNAYDRAGKAVVDTIEASDVATATESLRREGLFVVSVTEGNGAEPAAAKKGSRVSAGKRLKEISVFTRQLSVLIRSGTQVVEAMAALGRQVKPGPWRDTIERVRTRVEEGSTLAEAMQTEREYFDDIYCSLVAAGESSGRLSDMLERLADLKQKQLQVRNSVTGAMLYPTILTVIALGVLAMMLLIVVPRFSALFETLNMPLPDTTRALLWVSDLCRAYWWAVLVGIAAAVVGGRARLRTPAGKRALHKAILGTPKLGEIARSFSTARLGRLLGVLLEARLTLMDALRLTRHATGNILYRELIIQAEEQVSQGESMSDVLASSDLVTPSICEAVRSGERSGRMGPLLLNIADFLDEDNDIVLRSLTSIIEPVILVVMGLLVAVVSVGMFLPLFDLASAA